MARPKKSREIQKTPRCLEFVPGISTCFEKVILNLEELEAIRLHDLLGLEQKKSATQMNISQPTFHRILVSGRKKIADALINAKQIIIS
jgi:predicted DNA-binding protein (UPF0251 family)